MCAGVIVCVVVADVVAVVVRVLVADDVAVVVVLKGTDVGMVLLSSLFLRLLADPNEDESTN